MKKVHIILALTFLCSNSIIAEPKAKPIDFSKAEQGEAFPAGKGSMIKALDAKAFKHPLRNLPKSSLIDYSVGFAFFKKLWVSSPTATTASDGLGPLYNARSCIACHPGGGRGHPSTPYSATNKTAEYNSVSMFLRLSIPAQNEADKALLTSHKTNIIPDPIYGGQLQSFAVRGQSAEARLRLSYRDKKVELAGGEVVSLRHPSYSIDQLAYGKTHPQLMISPRVAPPVIGLGLLNVIAEQDILQLADPDDANKDGISGKPNQVWSKEYQRVMLGRFGYKAGQPTLNAQNQDAFNNDLGLSTVLGRDPWGDCTEKQMICRQSPHGDDPQFDHLEVPRLGTDALLYFIEHLSVPKRRHANDKTVLAGKQLFYHIGCTGCHKPSYTTPTIKQKPALSKQLIWPYTDLLLHDMGEGLADHRPEGDANGREWRTSPLWGIGLTKTVDKKAMYLHDGRARTLQEAILWHDGEAQAARNRFVALNKAQREQLLKFLGAL